jgi:hypothetical protein
LNGKRVLNFNGSQFMAEPNFAAFQLSGNKKFYIFAVWKFNTYSGTATVVPLAKSGGYTSSTSTAGYCIVRRWDKSPFSGTVGFYECQTNIGGGLHEFGSGPFTSTAFHLAEFHMPRQPTSARSITASVFVNRSLYGSLSGISNNGNPSADTIMKFTVGGQLTTTSYSPTNYFNGQIAEVCVYTPTGDITSSQLEGLRTYFKNKWNI